VDFATSDLGVGLGQLTRWRSRTPVSPQAQVVLGPASRLRGFHFRVPPSRHSPRSAAGRCVAEGLTVHWSGRIDAAGLARRASAMMHGSQGNTAVVRPLNSVVGRQVKIRRCGESLLSIAPPADVASSPKRALKIFFRGLCAGSLRPGFAGRARCPHPISASTPATAT